MSIDEVQTMAASQIAANSNLSAFGTPISYSDNLDHDTTKASIAQALREKGVILEIGEPDFEKGEGNAGRIQTLQANFVVSAAENPTVTHSPAGMALVKEIVHAVTRKISNYEQAPICTGAFKSKAENGYVLHEILFSVPVLVR